MIVLQEEEMFFLAQHLVPMVSLLKELTRPVILHYHFNLGIKNYLLLLANGLHGRNTHLSL